MPVTITIDTREQKPYEFENSVTRCLAVGDYSLLGAEHLIAIERKTLNDLIGCLVTGGRERFERELFKGKSLDYFALVVEASLSDLANGKYRSRMLPKSAVQSLLSFSVRHRLPVFFCESREYAQRVTESLLLKYAKEIEKKFKSITEKGN